MVSAKNETAEQSFFRTALIIFLRYPEPGKVKTRLAAKVGDKAAADFYKACTEYIIQVTRFANAYITRYVYYSEPNDRERIAQWLGKSYSLHQQCGDGLGERMKDAFETAMSNGAARAIIIGTDAPDITGDILEHALLQLETSDVVVGPAFDGGYYLLGLNCMYPGLFEGITWGSDNVFEKTMDKIQSDNLRFYLLPMLHDIDNVTDLANWVNNTSADHPLYAAALRTLNSGGSDSQ